MMATLPVKIPPISSKTEKPKFKRNAIKILRCVFIGNLLLTNGQNYHIIHLLLYILYGIFCQNTICNPLTSVC